MKRALLIAIIAFISKSITAQASRFKENETLNVWASSGLNMREKPDAKAAKVTTVPYGAKLVVQSNIGIKIPFKIEEFKGFIVKGYWLLVKYGNTEGFVFDGFLSRLPTPKNKKEDIEDYFNTNFKKSGERYNCKVYAENNEQGKLELNCNDTTTTFCGYFQKYSALITYSKNSCDETGNYQVIEIQDITLFEGFALIKFFLGLDKDKYKINSLGSLTILAVSVFLSFRRNLFALCFLLNRAKCNK